MKQIIQNYRTGNLELAEVPAPLCSSNKILVKNMSSLISIGTERSIIELGKKSLLGKAKARPDLVKRFIDKGKKEGFLKTFQEALGRLDNPTSLGYSSSGIVIEVGANVHKFSPGDKVACIGAGYASHAEYITVPEMLCARIPGIGNSYMLSVDGYPEKEIKDHITDSLSTNNCVSFEEASFGMLGIIALHGIRCAGLAFGESVAVIGLGLLGLLTVQILKAYGCKVIGMDIDPKKIELARSLGADYAFISGDDFKNCIERLTGGYGSDAVIITAATKSDAPVNTAVDVSKYRGKIVLVGVADIHPQRNEMWQKEVEIIVSKAGGPGTFDPLYENKGVDYPLGYIRWTENRNLEEFLQLVAAGRVNVKPLITHRFDIEQAESVYKNMLEGKGGPYIGVILQYPDKVEPLERIISLNISQQIKSLSQINVGVIGAGLFGKALLLPALKDIKDVNLYSISTASSANVYHTGEKYGFNYCSTDYKEVICNPDINTVIILTPHGLHAKMVIESLNAGKHVFVEKPLCTNEEQLREIISTYDSLITNNRLTFLMVGYNRRFSPHAAKAIEFIKDRQDPMVINYRINAGFVPGDHWVHAEEEGGSRIIGEVCHFVDIMQFFTKSNPLKVYAERISGNNRTVLNSDNVVITVKFEDGSVGNIVYSASGDKAYSREQIEIFCEAKTITIKDYKETDYHYAGKRKSFKTLNQEMGYKEELKYFFDVIKKLSSPVITPYEIFLSTLTVFKINESLEKGEPVTLRL